LRRTTVLKHKSRPNLLQGLKGFLNTMKIQSPKLLQEKHEPNFLSRTPLTLLFSALLFAAGSHDGGHGNDGHDDMHKEMAIGMPG